MNPLPKSIYFTAALAVIYLALIPLFLGRYFIADANMWMSILLLPYIIRIETGRRSGLRFLSLALFALVMSVSTGVATFFYFAIGFSLLFLIDNTVGKINWLPVIVLGLICPAFKYFSNIFGFAVRLQLSEIVGKMLQVAGMDVQVSGNVMIMGQCEFSVDPACMGLKMMSVSILAGLLIMAYFERAVNRNFRLPTVLFVVTTVLILNIISNLFRIMLLVMFRVLPESPAHDLVGVFCLIIYVVIPAWFIVKKLAKGKAPGYKPRKIRNMTYRKAVIHIMLILTIIICKLTTPDKVVDPEISALPQINPKGFTKTIIDKDVVKFEKPGVLVYIKPIRYFYGTDHNPMICWKGSGYEFKKIREIEISGKPIYTAVLERQADKLYSAWWYDNGNYQTTKQIDWRWKAIKGDKFNLVNVSCGSEQELVEQLKLMIGNFK